jgi:hypothetical protein
LIIENERTMREFDQRLHRDNVSTRKAKERGHRTHERRTARVQRARY